MSLGRPETWRQGRVTAEHRPGNPKEGLTHLFWVLLSSKFRAGVRAILNSQTFSLRVEEQIGKEEKISRVRKSVDLDLCGFSATPVSILYLAFRFTRLGVIDPCP